MSSKTHAPAGRREAETADDLTTRLAETQRLMAASDRRARWVTGAVWVCRLLAVIVPLVIWQTLSDRGAIPNFIFSNPAAIGEKLVQWLGDGTVLTNAWFTVSNAAIGYALGLVIAAASAAAFVTWPRVGATLLPFMAFANALPRIALAPLLVAWFGFGMGSNVALVVIVVVFVNFFNIYGGLSSLDEDQVTWAQSLGASSAQLWLTVRLPSIVRWVLGGMRTSVGLALSASVVSEFVGGARGVGFLVSSSTNIFQSSGVYAGIAVTVVVAGLVDTSLRLLEKRWAHWVGQG